MTTTTQPTAEQFNAYRAMFDHFNATLFGGTLPGVLLNLSRGSSKTVAFFAPGRWHREDNHDVVTHEISINPRHMKAGNPKETAQSLVHEMAHLWQHVQGTPPRTGYHDREWSKKMVEIGLQPINAKTGKPAMSAHSMSDKPIEGGAFEIAFAALPAAALLPWACVEARPEPAPVQGPQPLGAEAGEGGETAEPVATPSKNKIKYTCPGCGANVWGKAGLAIGCVDTANHDDEKPAIFVEV